MTEEIKIFNCDGNTQLIVPADRKEFPVLRQWILSIAAELDIGKSIQKKLLISCDEIFTNIASYAYPDGNGTVEVSIEFVSPTRELRIIFSDSGTAFDPLEISDPDTGSALSERKVGGLGMFMVKSMMDSVEYSRKDGKNILILTKCLEKQNK
ncbi:MAG: ATP-binding protein [Lentisphaerae bacterium]|nr:ATP-binding protein [Lentisphaerota bacterium]